MSINCKIFGHQWELYEKNPDTNTNDGYAKICERCEKMLWNGKEEERE